MNYYEQFVELTSEKLRATAKIRTDENGIEEYRAAVDPGELETYKKNVNGKEELIRPLRKSNKCYQFFIKDGKIIDHTWFKPVYPKKKDKNVKKDQNASKFRGRK